jgi:integrase
MSRCRVADTSVKKSNRIEIERNQSIKKTDRNCTNLNLLYLFIRIKMAKLGSVKYQIESLANESQIFAPGESRHDEKQEISERLGSRQSVAVNAECKIHSYRTYTAYKSEWHQCAQYCKTELGVRDVTQIGGEQVRSYLEHKTENTFTSHASFKSSAAAMSKFEKVLQDSRGVESGIREAIHDKSWRTEMTKDLSREPHTGTGFKEPERVIDNLQRAEHQLAGKMQLESGARLEGVSQIRADQLRGMQEKPVSGQQVGVVQIKEKGGYQRDIYVTPQTYQELKAQIEASPDQKIQINESRYLKDLKNAVEKSGEPAGRGLSHQFRYTAVQNRMEEIQKNGETREQALQRCSYESGHNRADITEHYLR